jgi:hypothetical protein
MDRDVDWYIKVEQEKALYQIMCIGWDRGPTCRMTIDD